MFYCIIICFCFYINLYGKIVIFGDLEIFFCGWGVLFELWFVFMLFVFMLLFIMLFFFMLFFIMLFVFILFFFMLFVFMLFFFMLLVF